MKLSEVYKVPSAVPTHPQHPNHYDNDDPYPEYARSTPTMSNPSRAHSTAPAVLEVPQIVEDVATSAPSAPIEITDPVEGTQPNPPVDPPDPDEAPSEALGEYHLPVLKHQATASQGGPSPHAIPPTNIYDPGEEHTLVFQRPAASSTRQPLCVRKPPERFKDYEM